MSRIGVTPGPIHDTLLPEELMADVLKLLKSERDTIKKQLNGLEAAIEALAGSVQKDVKKTVKKARKMSASAREKISQSQKARWAKVKKAVT
jgi:hypothetical protein